MARAVLAAYAHPPADRPRELAAFIDATIQALPPDPRHPSPPRIRRWLIAEPAMGRIRWPIPVLAAAGDLAALLEVSPGELEWLADARGLERTVQDERLRNYRYGALPRRNGSLRVVERPKTRLKAIQRRLLHELLDRVPAHPAAHGFTRGRSARTHAAAHVGRRVVLRMDLEDFFASIQAGRIYGIFRTCGYPEAVAHALTALTTNVVPARVWTALPRPRGEMEAITAHHRLGRRLATAHLPQGAPTSPALANLAAFRLDRRLAGLAASLGAVYTRYADDCVPRTLKEDRCRRRYRRMRSCTRDEGAGPVGLVALRGRPAGGDRKPPRGASVKSRGAERRGKGALSARQVQITKASESEPPMKCRKRIDDIQNRGRVVASGGVWREPADWPDGCPAWMVARA